MKKIESFTINHLKLLTGIYVSRKDHLEGITLTTFDIRLTMPNRESVIAPDAIHTLEHLGATFLRSHSDWQERIVYFGPMGCRTGFYLIVAGDYSSLDIFDLVKETFDFIISYEGDIPGASAAQCGNYQDQNLPAAKLYAKKFKKEVLINKDSERLNYPTN